MAFLFGGGVQRKSRDDMCKEYLNDIRRSMRTVQREEERANAKEKIIQKEILLHAQRGRLDMCELKAREMVRVRAAARRHAKSRMSLTSLLDQVSALRDGKRQADTLARITKTMAELASGALNPHEIHRILQSYQRGTETFSMVHEAIDEAMDEAFEADNETEDANTAVKSVFQEMGLDAMAIMQNARPPQQYGIAGQPYPDAFAPISLPSPPTTRP